MITKFITYKFGKEFSIQVNDKDKVVTATCEFLLPSVMYSKDSLRLAVGLAVCDDEDVFHRTKGIKLAIKKCLIDESRQKLDYHYQQINSINRNRMAHKDMISYQINKLKKVK